MKTARTAASRAAQPWRRPERAAYATDFTRSRGRLHPEEESATRSPFQRDRDRIIHSTAFRRLKQKTQVFVAHEGDHYRTRLTHSLEVAQIARSIARTLGLDEDLAETLALAHDLGHPPFGHAGEDELDACMASFGGFDHNVQTLRVVVELEQRYPRFDGLNLTWETLEGVVKHNGPVVHRGQPLASLPRALTDYIAVHDLELATYAGPEAQVAALADDIAYNNHDIDDGITAGLLQIDDLMELPLVGAVFREVRADYPDLSQQRWLAEAVRRLIGHWIADLVAETQRRAAVMKPKSAEDVRAADGPLVAFSEEMMSAVQPLRAFLFERMYKHYKVNRMRSQSRRILRDLFDLFLAEPGTLPPEWAAGCDGPGGERTARRACDMIAGMTDVAAIDEHRRLFNLERWL